MQIKQKNFEAFFEMKRESELKRVRAEDLLQEATELASQATYMSLHGNNKKDVESLLSKASSLRHQAKELVEVATKYYKCIQYI